MCLVTTTTEPPTTIETRPNLQQQARQSRERKRRRDIEYYERLHLFHSRECCCCIVFHSFPMCFLTRSSCSCLRDNFDDDRGKKTQNSRKEKRRHDTHNWYTFVIRKKRSFLSRFTKNVFSYCDSQWQQHENSSNLKTRDNWNRFLAKNRIMVSCLSLINRQVFIIHRERRDTPKLCIIEMFSLSSPFV